MIKIKGAQRTRFAKLYRQILREKHLTSSQVARRAGLGEGTIYNTISPSDKRTITLKRVMNVLQGLPLTKSQLNALVHRIVYGKSSKTFPSKPVNKNQHKSNSRNITQRLNQATKAKLNGMSAPEAAKKYRVGVSTIYRYAKRAREGQSIHDSHPQYRVGHRTDSSTKAKQIYQATVAKLNGMSAPRAAKKYHVNESAIYKYARRMKNTSKSSKHASKNTKSVKQVKNNHSNSSNQRSPQQLSLQPLNNAKVVHDFSSKNNVKDHSVENSAVKEALKRWDHGTVVLYKPVYNHKPSPLAESIKNHMASEQMNMRTLTYRTGLNHKRIHEFFNGKRQVLPRLTIFRLALGLNLKAHDLLQMNHTDVQISESIVSGNHHPAKQNERKPSHTLSNQLIDIIKKLDNNDVKLILPIAKRLLKSEG